MSNSFSTFHFEEFLNMLRLVVIKMLWIPIKIWYTRVERRDKNNSLKVMRCLRKVLLNFHQPDGLQVCSECHYSQGQRWIYIFLNLKKKNFNRNKENHTVLTGMKKAKTFLDDVEYLRDLTCASDDEYFYFKCLCYHSFKKMSQSTNYKLHFV